ncbi:competence protein CoiA family protein [Neobacillus bataviensis]|uniref:competence protein CoiA family protein n=1 Tax=Neobacillus bataviensis TaxID=220685 RepID=UPI001CBDDA7A|nr:competence protein CoiA family protein [Neobacillus bataviensis]
MGVKLHCAYDDTGDLVFIKDRIEKNRLFYCPYCKEEVFSKKGTIREHHFSHKPDTERSANFETILHFESKHYLAKKINENDGEGIELPFDLGEYIPALELLKKRAGISDQTTISLSEIKSFYDVTSALTETVIPGSQFIADILGFIKEDNKNLAIEVFVSHESDNGKIKFFKLKHFPYLELIPFHNEKGEI